MVQNTTQNTKKPQVQPVANGGGKNVPKKSPAAVVESPPAPTPAPAAPAAPAVGEDSGSNTETVSPLTEFGQALKDLQTKFKALSVQYVRMEKELAKRANKKGKGNNSKKGITPPGFKKPTQLSKELCGVLGLPEGTVLPRNEANRAVHTYLVEKKLQDPSDRRKIHPNPELKSLFLPGAYTEGSSPPNHFDLQGMLKHHFTSVPDAEGSKKET